MKIIYPYIYYFSRYKKKYIESFLSYKLCRFVRMISKMVGLLYLGGSTYNVVGLLHRESCRRLVSSQNNNMVHALAPLFKNSWINSKLFSFYDIMSKHYWGIISQLLYNFMVNFNLCDMWLFNWYFKGYLFINYCSWQRHNLYSSIHASHVKILLINK